MDGGTKVLELSVLPLCCIVRQCVKQDVLAELQILLYHPTALCQDGDGVGHVGRGVLAILQISNHLNIILNILPR